MSSSTSASRPAPLIPHRFVYVAPMQAEGASPAMLRDINHDAPPRPLSAAQAVELCRFLDAWTQAQPHNVFAAMAVEASIKQQVAARPSVKEIHVVYPHHLGDLPQVMKNRFDITLTYGPAADSAPPAYCEPPPTYSDEPLPPWGAAPDSPGVIAMSPRALAGGQARIPQMHAPQEHAANVAQPAQQVQPVSPPPRQAERLPDHLDALLSSCTRDFLAGHAGLGNSLEVKLVGLIAAISALNDEVVKINAFGMLYNDLSKPPSAHPNDSRRLAKKIFTTALGPALERTNPRASGFCLLRDHYVQAIRAMK